MSQLENSYTKIANELLEAIAAIRIPGEAMQILLVIIRKTCGYHKNKDAISLSQFVSATGMKKPNVCRAIKKLLDMNIIKPLSKKIIKIIEKDNAYISEYELNKDCASWKPLSKKITLSKKIKTVIKKDNLPLSKKIPTKETITKEIKERKESEILPSDYYQKTLKALGLPSTGIISPKDHSVLVALLKDNCNFDDIEQARIKRKKNRLEWIQDSVCEMRDARLATVAKPDENGIPILPNGYMDWDNMTFEQKQFAIQRGYEK